MYASRPHQPAVPRPSLSPPSFGNQASHLPAPFRQLHAPKSPLYRPAALRPTQVPARPPSAAPSISPKSLNGELADNRSDRSSTGAPSVFNVDAEEDDLFDESTIIEIEDGEEGGRVTGPPKRTHWKPDHESQVCDSPQCVTRFTFYTRRHHCRRCGKIFCHQHAMHFLPLNQNALVHPQGIPSRVCDCCYKSYRRSRAAAKRSGSISSASTDSTLSAGAGAGIGMATPKHQRPGVDQGMMAKMGSYVGSVPRDWSWSTF